MKKTILIPLLVVLASQLYFSNQVFAHNVPVLGTWILDKEADTNLPMLLRVDFQDVFYTFGEMTLVTKVGKDIAGQYPVRYAYDIEEKLYYVCNGKYAQCEPVQIVDNNTIVIPMGEGGNLIQLKRYKK
jgi:hypothetical protein